MAAWRRSIGGLVRRGACCAFLGFLALGCGGSGSSGFDIAEDAAIDRAIAGDRCVENGGLTICPTGPVSVTNSPGPTAPGQVDLGVAGQTRDAECASDATRSTCSLTLHLTTQGFPPSGEFRVALRRADLAGSWTVSRPATPGSEPGGLEAVLQVALSETAAPTVELAVLVFPQPSEAVPGEVSSLAESRATSAFVSPPIALRVVPGG
jgi:hypothetical protein